MQNVCMSINMHFIHASNENTSHINFTVENPGTFMGGVDMGRYYVGTNRVLWVTSLCEHG